MYAEGYFEIFETLSFVQMVPALIPPVQEQLRTWHAVHLKKSPARITFRNGEGEVSILVERNLRESNAFGYFGHTGKAPQAGFLCLEHNHLAPARLGLEGPRVQESRRRDPLGRE